MLELLTGIFSIFSSLFGGKNKKENNSPPMPETTAKQMAYLSKAPGLTTQVTEKAKTEAKATAKGEGQFAASPSSNSRITQASVATSSSGKPAAVTAANMRFGGSTGKVA
jgi:hypothetical protein